MRADLEPKALSDHLTPKHSATRRAIQLFSRLTSSAGAGGGPGLWLVPLPSTLFLLLHDWLTVTTEIRLITQPAAQLARCHGGQTPNMIAATPGPWSQPRPNCVTYAINFKAGNMSMATVFRLSLRLRIFWSRTPQVASQWRFVPFLTCRIIRLKNFAVVIA